MPPTEPEPQLSNKTRKVSGGLKPSITIPGPALKAAAAMAAATVRVLGVYLQLSGSCLFPASVLLTKGS